MKRYMILGLILGAAVGSVVWYLLHRRQDWHEFPGFYDSSTADGDLFSEGFTVFPDKP